MHRRRFLLFYLLPLALAGGLFAQTSPWPFPPIGAAKSTAQSRSITAAFWNVQWFPGRRPGGSRGQQESQIRSVQREIVALAPDVMGLAEMRDFASATLAVQPLPGFKVDVCSNFPPRERQSVAQQVAIASRLQPMSAWAEFWKTGGAITPPRGFAFAAYQLAPKQMLLVYALHLKSNLGELQENVRIREESIRQLLSHMQAMEQAYGKLGAIAWLVGGDFNTAPDDPRFAGEKTVPSLLGPGFQWSWAKVPAANRVTVPPDARFPAACFDHVFYRGASLQRAWVGATSRDSSDHRPACVSLNLPPN